MHREFGNSRQGGFGFKPREQREMHKATCAKCHQDCEVPFKPIKDKPVFCRDCYKKEKGY